MTTVMDMEVGTYVACDWEQPRQTSIAGFDLVFYTHRSPFRETDNEDSLAILSVGKDSLVIAVADGAGGLPKGGQASGIAVEELKSALQNIKGDTSRLRIAILDALEAANQKIQQQAAGSGSTISIVELNKATMRSYHVGDSLIAVCGRQGKLKYYAVPHSPVGYAVESGFLDEKSAMQHEDRHVVSNLLGFSDMHIEVGPILELASYDTVVVASDGLSDNLPINQIVRIIRKGSLMEAAQQLMIEARQRMIAENSNGKPDDLSFILARQQSH